MISFHFQNIFYFFILFIFLAVLFYLSRMRRKKELGLLGDWKLVQQMFPVESLKKRRMKDMILLISFCLLIISTAGPQFGSMMKEIKHRGVDIFIAIDISKSMLAEDVAPSRLERAKQSLSLLVKKLQGHRVGIIAFAKDAFLQCPLTIDTDAAQMFLEILDTNAVPRQGTSIGDAIRLALENFPKDEKSGKAIVLLTDGEDHQSDPEGAAKEAKDKGVVLFTIGIGTSKGEVIKNRDEQGHVVEYHKYQGEMVLTKLDDGLLNKLALTTGGQYYRSSSSDREIDEISDIINGFEKKELNSKIHERLIERFQVFAFIVFILLLIEYFISEKFGQFERVKSFMMSLGKKFSRNKKILGVFLLSSFISLGLRADFKDHILAGNKLIKKKDLPGARKEFESAQNDNPESPIPVYNIANSYYLEGKLDEAEKEYTTASQMTFDPRFKSQIAYNLGHLYFNMNKREQSLEQFKECLRLNPSDMDAKYNIEYILSGKVPKNPPPQQQKPNEGDKNKDNKSQDGNGDKQKQKEGEQGEKNKEGLSKEDAERILQMMKDQESEKFKNAIILRPGQKKDNKKEKDSGEDW